MQSLNAEPIDAAVKLRDLLASHKTRIVLAESCTAGRVAATLGALPGISHWLCGSFVIYRNDSKARWLDIPDDLLNDPLIGPVSVEVTRLLAKATVRKTPEARFGLAVTGDIGPGAAAATDGVCFCALWDRLTDALIETTFRLSWPSPLSSQDVVGRILRLDEATRRVLEFAAQTIACINTESPT